MPSSLWNIRNRVACPSDKTGDVALPSPERVSLKRKAEEQFLENKVAEIVHDEIAVSPALQEMRSKIRSGSATEAQRKGFHRSVQQVESIAAGQTRDVNKRKRSRTSEGDCINVEAASSNSHFRFKPATAFPAPQSKPVTLHNINTTNKRLKFRRRFVAPRCSPSIDAALDRLEQLEKQSTQRVEQESLSETPSSPADSPLFDQIGISVGGEATPPSRLVSSAQPVEKFEERVPVATPSSMELLAIPATQPVQEIEGEMQVQTPSYSELRTISSRQPTQEVKQERREQISTASEFPDVPASWFDDFGALPHLRAPREDMRGEDDFVSISRCSTPSVDQFISPTGYGSDGVDDRTHKSLANATERYVSTYMPESILALIPMFEALPGLLKRYNREIQELIDQLAIQFNAMQDVCLESVQKNEKHRANMQAEFRILRQEVRGYPAFR